MSSFSFGNVGYVASLRLAMDADALAYLQAAGITESTVYFPGTVRENTGAAYFTAIDNYVKGVKAGGIWDLLNVIYPFMGGTELSHKINLKAPTTFALTYVSIPLQNSAGMVGDNTATKYAKTGFIFPVNIPTGVGYSLHFYTSQNDAGDTDPIDMGVFGGIENALNLTSNNLSAAGPFGRAAGVRAIGVTTTSFSYYSTVQTPAGEAKFYANGVNEATTVGTAVVPINLECYLLAMNLNSSPYGITQRAMGFAAMGRGFTAAQQTEHYRLIEILQRAMKRGRV